MSYKNKVMVIGKSGQVARELQQVSCAEFDIVALGRDEINILESDSIRWRIEQLNPIAIINAAAYTAVDKAEVEKVDAFALNEKAVKLLAREAKKAQIRFIHLSTDFVFNGSNNAAYSIKDETSPIGVYGCSKRAGEIALKNEYNENSSVVRTSWVYSVFGNNFVKSMLRLMNERNELNVVSDQIGCPTDAFYLARFLLKLVTLEKIEPMYHWTDDGVASWYDFAVAIYEIGKEKELIKKEVQIYPIRSSEYKTLAVRPAFSLLDRSDSNLVMKTNHWRKNLTRMMASFDANLK